jgi:hypothetical protein
MRSSFLLAAFLAAVSGWAQPPAGRWDGTVVYGKLKVPFTIQFEGGGAAMAGAFVNGDARVSSTAGTFDGNRLLLNFASGTRLDATLVDGGLKGTYGSQPFTAAAYCTCGLEGAAGPAIMGAWEIPEAGWRLLVERKGEDTLATVSRPGGDIGPITGRHDGLTFLLHYFDGTRAAVLELEERKDGALDVVWMEPGKEPVKSKAVRLKAARK